MTLSVSQEEAATAVHFAQRPLEHRSFGEADGHAEVEMRRPRPLSGGRRCSLDALGAIMQHLMGQTWESFINDIHIKRQEGG